MIFYGNIVIYTERNAKLKYKGNDMNDKDFRVESDSMGEMKVPAGAYWGAQTQRAVENFPVSGLRFPRRFIRALGMIKAAAAEANIELGLLDPGKGESIAGAAREVMEGNFDDQFVLDVFQTGSGTSTNMNANEVIASRANELLGGTRGSKSPVHPNDHVNMGQSSNDVIPSAIHVAALEGVRRELLPSLENLREALGKKSAELDRVVKIGRTHMQDATPVRLGQELGGYETMVAHGIGRIGNVCRFLSELAIGGTAVGTGINTHREFARLVVERVNAVTGLRFTEAENHFEAQGARDALVETSSALKTLAVSLMKVAGDIRFLACGPRCGIGELILPAVQPGSSIMPGKVNPVIVEALLQVCAQVIGNDAAITIGGFHGNLELNVMMPLIAYNLLQSIGILANGVAIFREKCIAGLQADEKRIGDMIERSLALVTAFNPYIGYDAAAKLAKESDESGKTIRQVALEKELFPKEKLREILDPSKMTDNK
jgi:fumarate hydratase class II